MTIDSERRGPRMTLNIYRVDSEGRTTSMRRISTSSGPPDLPPPSPALDPGCDCPRCKDGEPPCS